VSRIWSPIRRGQASVETALVVPVLLLLAFGVVATGRVAHGQMAASAIAREAARAAALADSAADAQDHGISRARDVAAGYGLNEGMLDVRVEPGAFSRGGEVRASVRYVVSLQDLPLLSGASVPIASSHRERVDLYRSRWQSGRDR
jgi:Flp pilus assembly protein TadG